VALVAALAATGTAVAPIAPGGSAFASSDPEVTRIWEASVRTARDMLAPGPLKTDAEGRPCAIALPTVLLDGVARDRCPYAGDQAVTGMTLLVSTPAAASVLRAMILWYADAQHENGAIPSSPDRGATVVRIDYNAYWVEDLYDYVLYTGDRELARQVWPHLVKLMDAWYPAQVGELGLLVNDIGSVDYGDIPRTGTTVAYYNAGYVRALRLAAQLATWVGEPGRASAWKARIAPVAAGFGPAFWDSSVGAYRDSTVGKVVHPEDGNVFAVLAGLASYGQAESALHYLAGHDWQPYGAAIADNDTWDGFPWGDDADKRVYPFMSYYELVARYETDLDASALTLIRREWGYMLANGPSTTMWETIGPFGGPPVNPDPSWDHGWSSGAAPALTNFALGLTPTSPGFGSYLAQPHPADLTWASGIVPTPNGPISLHWARAGGAISATVVAPVPGRITLPADGAATLDGKRIPEQWGETSVRVPRGTHTLVVKLS
jgi:hypothetical protein